MSARRELLRAKFRELATDCPACTPDDCDIENWDEDKLIEMVETHDGGEEAVAEIDRKLQAAIVGATKKMVDELRPLPEPPTYATVEEAREAFGAGSPFDPTGKTDPNEKPVTFPKVLSALEMCISIAEDELAGTDGYSIVAEAEAELAALRAASKAGGGA